MLNAIGGGLIGWGALLLVSTLTAPTSASGTVDEYERTSRNTQAATALSIASTAAGAVLILVNHAWLYALAGVALGALTYYAVQVAVTHRAWRGLAARVKFERARLDGRVTTHTATRIGMLAYPAAAPESHASHALSIEGSGPRAAAIVTERARLSWALWHPRGGRPAAPALPPRDSSSA